MPAFLDQVKANNGLLHVSLDVDFLDPSVAPAVGTSVPGGATIREAHLVMEILYDSGLMSSLASSSDRYHREFPSQDELPVWLRHREPMCPLPAQLMGQGNPHLMRHAAGHCWL